MSDNSRTITPFNGNNYNIWKSRVRALIDESILEENALAIIDSESVPENVSARKWMKYNKIAKGIIIRSLGDSIVANATRDPNLSAREIFQILDNLYMRVSIATELAMEMKFVNFKFDESTTLTQHFMVFDEMISDLEVASGDKLKEANKIARLLSTLPKSYKPLTVAIKTFEHDKLNLAFVKVRLLDHEVELKQEREDTSAKTLMVEVLNKANKNYKNKNRQNFKKYKNNNNRRFDNKRFQYHKYNNPKNKINRNQLKCDHCGRLNHMKRDCIYYKKMCNENSSYQATHTAFNKENEHFVFMIKINNNEQHEQNYGTEVPFILDSGATDHLVNQLDIFSTINDLEEPVIINIAKRNEVIKATKNGTISVTSGSGFNGILKDVYYVPEIPFNLLSVSRMQESGLSVIFSETGEVMIMKNNKIIINGKKNKNLITISLKINNKICNRIEAKPFENKYKIWHERLGHLSKAKFLELQSKDLIENSNTLKSIVPNIEMCETCIYSKQCRLPFNKSKDKSHIDRPLYIIHTDVCGPIKPTTIDNKNYFVTFIDEFTHYTVVYLITYKSQVLSVFRDYLNKSETHFNLKVAYLYCDNGTEYLNNEFKELCSNRGIQYHLTKPYTPQQNSVAERMNRTLVEKARAMVHGANLGKAFWGEAIKTASHLVNISPTKAIQQDKTPFELWHKRKPNIDRLKIFGCTVYVLIKNQREKFDKKSKKGIFVGYVNNGYRILDTTTNEFIVARDVIFDEINFKASRLSENEENENGKLNVINEHSNENENGKLNVINEYSNKNETDKLKEISKYHNSNGQGNEPSDNSLKRKRKYNEIDKSIIDEVNKTMCKENIDSDNADCIRRSARLQNKQQKSYNEDDQYYNLCAQSIVYDIPKTYNEIKSRIDRKEWEKAIQTELDSLLKNKTWNLVSLPINKNVIDCKWVFTLKKKGLKEGHTYKARLVAKGYSQEYLSDYFDTFAPVARITTLRLMLAYANQHDLIIHQMDVKTAFLNGKLDEEIYMKVPEGITADQRYVCKLNKALYGLKQAARCWYQHFDNVIKKYGFIPSTVDRCLYFMRFNNIAENAFLLLYVDDILIFTHKNSTMIKIKQYLTQNFEMVDLNEIKTFLGINIKIKNGELTLDQNDYLKNVLKKFNMGDCNSISTPLPTKLNYEGLNSDVYHDAPCRELIGCLMYAMLCTRPDLSVSLNMLSRFQNKNNKELWQSLKRILRYVKGTLNSKLVYRKNEFENIIVGFVDADWASNEIDRKSTTGYVFKLYNNTISWNSKKQNSVATSSTEAEYMALFEGVKEACWLKSVLESIKIEISDPITIYEDNNSCIAIAKNPTDHKRSKHIDVKYHFTREKVEQKLINIKYIPTGSQLADMFTKSLPVLTFKRMLDGIGMEKISFCNYK